MVADVDIWSSERQDLCVNASCVHLLDAKEGIAVRLRDSKDSCPLVPEDAISDFVAAQLEVGLPCELHYVLFGIVVRVNVDKQPEPS
jgi:hypothetical protein